MFTNKDLKILGLSASENEILKALQKKPYSPSFLAEIIKLPRTTVTFLLNKLKERGLIEKSKVGKRFFYKTVAKTELSYILRKISNHLDPNAALFEITVGKRQSEIEIYKGKEKMKEAFHKVLKVNRGNRVYGLQGNKSIEKSLNKIEWDFIYKYHNTLKKKGIIMEGISGENSLKMFEGMSNKQLKSHLERLTVIYLAPDEFFDFDLDILVFQNIVMMINYDEETILLIKDSKIQETMQKIIAFMETHSRKIDLNTYLRDLINKRI
ncbi:hypothetical protein A2997_00440 [Candidatus Nomurabacteria bacterium RIFCSPLOWO2_01_FULL_36_10b]|uniref:HTH arsR-type domain-containing protein n=1 Tax=Candidatus Nomurabacteria bacterium RIFCSPLOWO2_01_FULL_36_10b TaxID=1801766 RepID=A0A1F6WPV3_9BACT|nr:MAG: hypothetical protein A2997_00440 [Candidatus Nomurabacteria bacterium RIFCSPLOWO2_01_FULL_36_10b]